MKLQQSDIERMVGADEDDPIVWQLDGQRETLQMAEFRHVLMRLSDLVRLVSHGVDIEQYVAHARHEMAAWESGCEATIN